MTETLVETPVKETSNEYYLPKHIVEAKTKEGREIPIDIGYDPKLFWEALGKDYIGTFDHPAKIQANVAWIIDRLKVLKPDSVLEVGCGFARLAPFIVEAGIVDKYNGVDIAPSIMNTSEHYLKPPEISEEDKKKPDFIQPVDL